jgi:hypothetical protein
MSKVFLSRKLIKPLLGFHTIVNPKKHIFVNNFRSPSCPTTVESSTHLKLFGKDKDLTCNENYFFMNKKSSSIVPK